MLPMTDLTRVRQCLKPGVETVESRLRILLLTLLKIKTDADKIGIQSKLKLHKSVFLIRQRILNCDIMEIFPMIFLLYVHHVCMVTTSTPCRLRRLPA